MNVQNSQEETAEEGDFEEQMQDDITLVGLTPYNFLPVQSRMVNMQRNGNFVMARNGKFSHADQSDEVETEQAPNHEPAPYGEGAMPHNVGSLTTHRGPYDRNSNPFEQFRKRPAKEEVEEAEPEAEEPEEEIKDKKRAK